MRGNKMFMLTVHVEFKLSVRVHAHFYPFECTRLHLFEMNNVVPGGSISVRVEMEIVASETCRTINNSTDCNITAIYFSKTDEFTIICNFDNY